MMPDYFQFLFFVQLTSLIYFFTKGMQLVFNVQL